MYIVRVVVVDRFFSVVWTRLSCRYRFNFKIRQNLWTVLSDKKTKVAVDEKVFRSLRFNLGKYKSSVKMIQYAYL